MNKPARKPRARVTRVAPLGVLALLLATASYAAREKTSPPGGDPAASVSLENPELLSFDELITLSTTAKPDGPLAGRLDALLNRPFVHRETSAAEAPPRRPNGKGEGPILRVGLWNIERGLNLDLIRLRSAVPMSFCPWRRSKPARGFEKNSWFNHNWPRCKASISWF